MLDTDPITLKEACEIVFRNTCTVHTLRAEAERGNLEIAKIGKRWYTTLQSARELYFQCLVEPSVPASTATRNAVNTSSATVAASLDSATQAILMLRKPSPHTSRQSTDPKRARGH